jgi:hypothetical protein
MIGHTIRIGIHDKQARAIARIGWAQRNILLGEIEIEQVNAHLKALIKCLDRLALPCQIGSETSRISKPASQRLPAGHCWQKGSRAALGKRHPALPSARRETSL